MSIVRAVAIKPRFLIFDEPMSAEVLDFIAALRGEGRDTIIVSHSMGFAREESGHCLFIARGQVHEAGRSAAIFHDPKNPLRANFPVKVLGY